MTNQIQDVKKFNELSGADLTKFNVRSVGLYKGLQLEELLEGLDAIFKNHVFQNSMGYVHQSVEHDTMDKMRDMMNGFKKGYYDVLIQNVDRKELLDSDIDSTYVAIGAALASGADVEGAWNEIQGSNMSKANPDTGKMDKDANGKIIKGSAYFAPDLTKFVKA